jgi:hypothetical protein
VLTAGELVTLGWAHGCQTRVEAEGGGEQASALTKAVGDPRESRRVPSPGWWVSSEGQSSALTRVVGVFGVVPCLCG